MSNDKQIRELEQKLQELKREEAATYVESPGRTRTIGKPMKLTKWIFLLIGVLSLLLVVNFVRTFEFSSLFGNNTVERKSAFVERLQENEELVTAEAYIKSVIQKEDYKSLPFDLKIPGTTRQVLIIFPGKVQAGIDLSAISETDIELDEAEKTATFIVPKPTILNEPTLFMDEVQAYSHTGLLSDELDLSEAYDLAAEAQELMIKEATTQGLLALAETNAEKVLQDMFQLVDYDVTIEFEE